MNQFHEMLRKVTSSSCYDQTLQFIKPLQDHFGVNHFWYYQVTFSGHYTFFGTHMPWNEFCFDQSILGNFPCLRHPSTLQTGISLMKASDNQAYKNMLDTAWSKFQINFNINLQKKIPKGIEAFGFGTRFNDPNADERLLNNLPMLYHFIKIFRLKHKKLFRLLEDNQVDLASHLGSVFYQQSQVIIPSQRDLFLRRLGFEAILSLTAREKDVLKFVSSGYPASYIAQKLKLSCRTVENYLATIKCKLSCQSKVELIQKTQEIASMGFLDLFEM